MNKKIELLAPAGNLESMYAAVSNGADAIYMGGSKFSARAYAQNFTLEDMKSAVDYCHIYGVKVYITVNTLIKDSELKEAIEYIKHMYEMGVDALIIQDLGLLNIMQSQFSDFEIHASTQMTVHNKEACELLIDNGFKRIVLSRELSLKEITEISKDYETEIFVHGALCVCYSGQCLMSSMLGGRSGNRGRCAQTCRLPYKLINNSNQIQRSGYLLSPKDICTLADIKSIIQGNVSSLKIEGRMKRPEYVAGVVSTYRRVIDSYYDNNWSNDLEYENKRLLQLFNREGFSKAYLFGNTGKDMMAYGNPKNTGVPIGKVLEDGSIKLLEAISVKDGIRVDESGTIVNKILKNGVEIEKAAEGTIVKLQPKIFKKNDVVYKTNDNQFNEELKESFKDKYIKKLPLDVIVNFEIGKNIVIETNYLGKEYIASGSKVENVLKKPVSKEFLEDKIKKTGNTPFIINRIQFINIEEGFLSAAAINDVRRELLKNIEEDITSSHRRNYICKELTLKHKSKDKNKVSGVLFIASTYEQYEALKDLNVDNLAIDFFRKGKDSIKIGSIDIQGLYLKIPNIIKEEFGYVQDLIEKNLHRIKGIITANLGIIKIFSGKTSIIGDYKLNIFNSGAAQFIEEYCDSASLSLELNKNEIYNIGKKNKKLQYLIYGKIELMVSEYCPIGSIAGGKTAASKCSQPCLNGKYYLKDRMSEDFIVCTDIYCRSHIYNSVPINLTEQIKELKDLGMDSFRVDFIDENYEETKKIALAIKENKVFQMDKFTRGHYKRGVE
ncbi:U32 family peptidase [Clostridium sp. 19966]|uniref:U32 family peptidase n=1 Tax=Clostridium sp. 19966 TaxID=2768166 RepID=UPI0028DFFCAA|nr:U32 family peptidase [Clostridium sp. 19966]MDT8716521.1 U32 family peptidase [Clostridium sp. 19966]